LTIAYKRIRVAFTYRCFIHPDKTKHNLRLGDESEVLMVGPLDVFVVENGECTRLSSAGTLTQAIESIRKTGCGSYFIFSQKTENKTFYEVSAEGLVSQVVA
jgi:hypothetical protein